MWGIDEWRYEGRKGERNIGEGISYVINILVNLRGNGMDNNGVDYRLVDAYCDSKYCVSDRK